MFCFLKKIIFLLWARWEVCLSEIKFKNAEKEQEKLLLTLVKKAEKTLFGKIHEFQKIRSVKDFQEKVKITDYEGLKNYIEKIKHGDRDILYPKIPEYLAKTSGTTSGAKYIPLSKEGIKSQINAARLALFYYVHKTKKTNFLSGKMIFLQGSPKLEEKNGIKVGRLSGIVAHHIPGYLRKNRLPKFETNCIEDWENKVDEIVKETQGENMTLVSGIPPWLIMYFEKLSDRNKKKIKELFPNLELIITGGVNYEPYQDKMEMLLGGKVDILQTFPASEGFFAFQDKKQEEMLLLTHHGIFYEFIPLEKLKDPSPPRLILKEIELNKDYAMVITTNSGLWAYSIGDVIRFVSKKPYRITISGRTRHYTSAFGEHVIGHEAEESLKETCKKYPCRITEFHLAPQVNPDNGQLPYHEWFIEFEKEPEDIVGFRTTLDLELRKRNSYYNDLITGNILQELVITKFPKNTFLNYARINGKLGGQNKIPRLANDRKIADQLLESQP
ncbi:MAG: GH3 auxin-responsive promoter family protein [Bergeyella sp.]|nr:GH3 auxin-responsive promoter family protein [Bergeyella sp.]